VAEADAESLGDRHDHRCLSGCAGKRLDHHRGGSLEAKENLRQHESAWRGLLRDAPSVLEFDKAGNLLEHWGGPGKGYNWPNSNHGITVDYKGNVWIGGNGRTVDPKLQDTGASTCRKRVNQALMRTIKS